MKITENYRIDTSGEGCTLVFSEIRTRKDGKSKGESYTFEEPFYYSTIQQCLKAFLDKSLEKAKDVEDCVRLINETYKKIENLK